MNTSVISLLFLIFYNISFGDVENSVDRQICDSFNKEFKNLSVSIVNNRPEDKVKPTVSKVEQGADLIKDQFDKEIRCQYNIQILNGDQPKTQVIYSKECFDISTKTDYSVEYEASKTKIEMNGKSKILVRDRLADHYYFWEIGSCSPQSQTVFESINGIVDTRFLSKNNFYHVRLQKRSNLEYNSNSEYKLFYANPGFLIKTAKCKENEKCKKNELKVVSKKRLTDAILRKNNLVLTTDDY